MRESFLPGGPEKIALLYPLSSIPSSRFFQHNTPDIARLFQRTIKCIYLGSFSGFPKNGAIHLGNYLAQTHASALSVSLSLQVSAEAACSADLFASYKAASRPRSDSLSLVVFSLQVCGVCVFIGNPWGYISTQAFRFWSLDRLPLCRL